MTADDGVMYSSCVQNLKNENENKCWNISKTENIKLLRYSARWEVSKTGLKIEIGWRGDVSSCEIGCPPGQKSSRLASLN